MSDTNPQAGDVVGGDQIAIGSISGAQAVAIGRGAQAIVNITELSKSDRLDQRNRGVLLNKIKDFWIDDVFLPTLDGQEIILLDKETQHHAIENPLHERRKELGVHSEEDHNEVITGKHIDDVFDDFERSLLVLGDPGAGKTTTLLALVDHFIALAAKDINEPIPIMLHLASWQHTLSIEEWVVEELNAIYHVPVHIARQWMSENALLLVMDGLDELAATFRQKCIVAINLFRRANGLTPVAVSCREDVYHELGTKLELGGAIRIRPLRPNQIEHYIGDRLQPLREAIARDMDIAQMATNFLTLKLMIEVTLADKLAELVAQDSHMNRLKFLLETTHNDLLLDTGEDGSAKIDRHDRWLAWLASRMVENNQSVFLMQRMQPRWLRPVERVLYYAGVAAVIAPLIFQVIWWMVPLFLGDVLVAWIASSIIALVITIFAPIRPVEFLRWSPSSLIHHARKMPFLGMLVGAGFGLLSGLAILPDNPSYGMVGVLEDTLAFAIIGLPIGFIFGGFQNEEVQATSNPNKAILISGLYGIIAGVVMGLVSLVSLFFFPDEIFAHIIAIPAALYYGGLAFIQHSVLRFLLIVFRHAPVRYIPFLDSAAESGILRNVGDGYIFSHRSTLQHFADLTTEDDIPASWSEEPGDALAQTLGAEMALPAAQELVPLKPGEFARTTFGMVTRTVRLNPGEDLKRQLEIFAEDNHIEQGVVLACVGHLSSVVMAHTAQSGSVTVEDSMAVVSLSGTVGKDTTLQLIVTDGTGRVLAGELHEGSKVADAMRVVIGAATE